MPEKLVGPDKALYLAALKNTIPMYSTTGKMDPKGAQAVLAVFSQSCRKSRRPISICRKPTPTSSSRRRALRNSKFGLPFEKGVREGALFAMNME